MDNVQTITGIGDYISKNVLEMCVVVHQMARAAYLLNNKNMTIRRGTNTSLELGGVTKVPSEQQVHVNKAWQTIAGHHLEFYKVIGDGTLTAYAVYEDQDEKSGTERIQLTSDDLAIAKSARACQLCSCKKRVVDMAWITGVLKKILSVAS